LIRSDTTGPSPRQNPPLPGAAIQTMLVIADRRQALVFPSPPPGSFAELPP
jgi:hypothetical protein